MDKIALDTLSICNIYITNGTGTKRFLINEQTLSLSIYESIFQPLVKCEILVLDALALAHDLPFIGEEKLEVEIRSSNAQTSTKYTFLLHGMDNGTVDSGNKNQVFMLKGTSVEFIDDAAISLQKSYFDTYVNMVTDVVSKVLGSKKSVFVSPSKGAHRMTTPNVNPLRAIDMMRQRATSNVYPYSPFLFYETSKGFYFTDIVSRFKDAKNQPLNEITRVFKMSITEDSNDLEGNAWNSIVAFSTVAKHDTTTKTHMGAFYNKMQKFDLLTKQYSIIETKLTDVGKKFDLATAGEFNTKSFINKMSNGGQLNFMSITDSSLPESHLDYVGQKRAYSVLFFQNIVEAEFHGDTTLEAGKVLYLDINKTTGQTGSEQDTEDKHQSGYYMISNLAYHIILKNEATMTVACELVKGANKSIAGKLD